MSSSITQVLDDAAGKAQNTQGESIGAFLASLTTSAIILSLGIIAYVFLKSRVPAVYSQRTFRTSKLTWMPSRPSLHLLFSPLPDPDMKDESGFNNYLFDRYLHTLASLFLLLGLAIPPILLPLNAFAGRGEPGGIRGLDRLSFSNVSPLHTGRYWAHLVLAILAVLYICHILQREIRDYDRLRQTLASAWDDLEGLSSMFIVSNSKKPFLTQSVRRIFHDVAGGVSTITVNRDYNSLRDMLRRRKSMVDRLEIALTKLTIEANYQKGARKDVGPGNEIHHVMQLWMRYLDQDDRPHMRLPARPWLPSLPYLGPRVDTIYHLRKEISRLNRNIEWAQRHPSTFPATNSALVCFNRRLTMPLAALALKTGIPTSWTLKHGAPPDDIIWENVPISWWQQLTRTTVVHLLVAALVLGFAFPVAVAGTLSQVRYLASVIPGLEWLNELPTWLIAAIQGVLPQAMVSLVTLAVPDVFRLLVNMQGLYLRRVVENRVQIYYFLFLFVQVFLTVSLSAGVTTIAGELTDGIKSIPEILARNLPKASNYFFSYILIYTFTTIAYALLQLGGLVQILVLSPLLDKTARQIWARRESMDLQKWGTFLPKLTNIACIVIIYSVIAPLILFFGAICFTALWILYRRYPPKLAEKDLPTGSLFYPTAIRQLMTGVYCMELCLAGLFLLVRDTEGKASCTPQAISILITIVLTAFFHFSLNEREPHSPWLTARHHWNRCTSPVSHAVHKAVPNLDEALTSTCPVPWIPRDSLGISGDLIRHASGDGIVISDEGAYLERGRVTFCGPPPAIPKMH